MNNSLQKILGARSNLFFRKNSIIVSLVLVLVIMVIVISSINPLFISLKNLRSIFVNIVVLAIMSIGVSFVMISGNLDISIGSTLAVSAIFCAKLFNIEGFTIPLPVIIAIGVLIGAAIGVLNGILVVGVGVNSVITTLGTLSVFRGFAYLFSTGSNRIYNKTFLFIGRGNLFGNFSITFVYLILIFIFVYLLLRNTKFGRHIYSVGANKQVARIIGINIKKIQFISFVISGITAGIGGILLSASLGLANAQLGLGYEFKILSVCVLGGVSIAGGRGSIIGVIIATFILGSLTNGLILMDISLGFRDAFQGIILISAILIDSVRIRSRSLTG